MITVASLDTPDTWELRHCIVAAAFAADNTLAFALGTGSLELVSSLPDMPLLSVPVHEGAILCMVTASAHRFFYSGGDDGRVRRIGVDGSLADCAAERGGWIGSLLLAKDGLAFTCGREVHWRPLGSGSSLCVPHPSTAAALAIDPKGKRLAVAHYNGVSLWWTAARQSTPKLLPWRGSHTGVTWSPDGAYVISATQENELHGWRLADGHDFRMSGYPRKVRSFAWTQRGHWLATSGAEAIVLWPFRGRNGPLDQEPKEIAVDGGTVTAVASHPAIDRIAAGMEDGAVWLADVTSGARRLLRPGRGAAITALTWSHDGTMLAAGTERGEALRWQQQ